MKVLFTIFAMLYVFSAFAGEKPLIQKSTPPVKQPSKNMLEDTYKWKRDPFIGKGQKNLQLSNNSRFSPRVISKKFVYKGIKTSKTNSINELEEDINLQGIMKSNSSYNALINGRIVNKGDVIAGLTVVQISRYAVTIQNDKKEQIVYDIYQGRVDKGKK